MSSTHLITCVLEFLLSLNWASMVSASIWHASLVIGFQWSIVVNGLDMISRAESELRNLMVALHGGLTLHMVLRETITRLAISMSASSYSQRASRLLSLLIVQTSR